MDLREQRYLAALMFESFQRHGNSIASAVEQSLEASEQLILRSVEREKARQEAELQRAQVEAELARKRKLLTEGLDDQAPASSFAGPAYAG